MNESVQRIAAQHRARELKDRRPPPRYDSADHRFSADLFSCSWPQKLALVAPSILRSLQWEEGRALGAWPPAKWDTDEYHFRLFSLCCTAMPSVEAELLSALHQRFVLGADYQVFSAWAQCVVSERINPAFVASFEPVASAAARPQGKRAGVFMGRSIQR